MNAEEEVRAAWSIGDNGKPYLHVFFNCYWNVSVNGDVWQFPQFATEAEAWQAALDFTRKRQQEIAEIEEERAFIDSFQCVAIGPANEEARQRILSRLTAQRDELRKGMKAEIGGEK